MASTVQNFNAKTLNHNHINFSSNTFRSSKSHSFGQVSLPMKKLETTTRTTTTISSSSSTISPQYYAAATKLAELWREIQGCDDWEDLVEPLNPLLQSEIVRYGEFVAACYKAFDFEPASKRYLNCKYAKKNMLSSVGLENSGYKITKYIYASPDIPAIVQNNQNIARWIGYVAIASDEEAKRLGRRDIMVAFRGTVTGPEWVANMMSNLTPAGLDPQNPRLDVKVESGFLSLYTSGEITSKFGPDSCREQLLSEISRVLREYEGEEMSITLSGHSMGSSIANLLAYDIVELGLNKRNPNSGTIPVTVFSFGGPRVGNLRFKQRCEELGVKVLRVVNVNDPITKMPGVLFNENFRVSFPWSCANCYAHVGVELVLDFFNMQNPSCVHDLDTYINYLLKCSSRAQNLEDHDYLSIKEQNVDNIFGGELLNRAKDLIWNAQQNFNNLPWART